MNVVFRSVYAGLAAGAALMVSAAPLHAQSLEEALVQSYLSNPTLMAARAELRSVDENIAQALGGYRPTVTATGDLTQEWSETKHNVLGLIQSKLAQSDDYPTALHRRRDRGEYKSR